MKRTGTPASSFFANRSFTSADRQAIPLPKQTDPQGEAVEHVGGSWSPSQFAKVSR